jgi:putative addiction module component (TIGR02574 family)
MAEPARKPAPEPSDDADLGEEWDHEIERRIRAHEANPGEALDWDDFIAKFRAAHGCA